MSTVTPVMCHLNERDVCWLRVYMCIYVYIRVCVSITGRQMNGPKCVLSMYNVSFVKRAFVLIIEKTLY